MAGVSTSGPLILGNLPGTSSVVIGKGSAITVNNVPSTPTITFAAPVTSSSVIDSKVYQLRVTNRVGGSLATFTNTVVPFDTVETVGGGSNNFAPLTAGNTVVTIPVAGTYSVKYNVVLSNNSGSLWTITSWVGSSSSGTQRLGYAMCTTPLSVGLDPAVGNSFIFRFAAGDTLFVVVNQSTGITQSIQTDANNYSCLYISRIGA